MRILYIERDKKNCNYYQDTIRFLAKINTVFLYYTKLRNDFNKVYNTFKPDCIIIGFSISDIDGNPNFYINTNCPVYIILNKEYQNLNDKLEWIKKVKPKKVFTVHHDYKKYSVSTNIPFDRIMWSADHTIFKKYDDQYKYDLFFSGVIREEQTGNLRNKIYNKLEELSKYNLKTSVSFYKNGKLDSKIYKFDLDEYTLNLNHSKICLSTTGPGDLIGTRYFEIMATNKALIMCNKMPKKVYDKYLIDGFNCIMFVDEDDFIKKTKYYLENEKERIKIVHQAYQYFMDNLTWDKSINKMLKFL